jgi:lysophospholipid acyltransferase (LPLAT)-like uncharacterized protein
MGGMTRTRVSVARAAYWLLALLVRGICLTLRVTRKNFDDVDRLRREKKTIVYAFWHGSMMLGWYMHRPKRGERVAALVSMSKDGAILASVLEAWGFALIRGSSHIGGKEALQAMVDAAAEGSTLCVTPDGPTGPRHQMKPGALLTAQRAHVPLVIVGIASKRKKVFPRSWDRFEIPLPFSEVCLCYDGPIGIPANADRDAVNELLGTIQQRLDAAHHRAHEVLGIGEILIADNAR